MAAIVKSQMAFPDYVDEAGKSAPHDTWAIVPRSTAGNSEGWQYLTYEDLSRTTNGLAWWIEQNVGVASTQGQTIGYMGPNDFRYLLVLAAVMKNGYIPLFNSPRNSIEGQVSLVEKTNCEIFLATKETRPRIDAIKEAVVNLKVFEIPTVDEIVEMSLTASYYPGRHSRDADARSLILHTSGSTGLPKPIFLTVRGLNTIYEQASLEPEGEYHQVSQVLLTDKRPMLAPVPFFHSMGIIIGMSSVMCRSAIVRLPSDKIVNAGLVIDAIEATNPASALFPPSLLEDISSTQEGMDALAKLERVFFGGAPLATAIGDKIRKVTNLTTVIGSTEGLFICSLQKTDPEDWNYFHWSSASGAVMEPAEGDLYELVLKPRDTRYQGIFNTFPEAHEWRTKDLFKQHPSKPFLWKYSGRHDDLIVLSNGEKFNPVSTEKLIESHPWIKGAIVVGQGQFQAGLLIEPEWSYVTSQDSSTFINEIWPIVEQANREAPAHARIYQAKIIVASQENPFVRTPKGSIIRIQTNALFNSEIEALYTNEGDAGIIQEPADATLTSKIHAIFSQTLPAFREDMLDDADIFDLGVDSLDVLSVANKLNKSIRGVKVTAPTIYSNPTVAKLAEFLARHTNESNRGKEVRRTREEKLDEMVRKYTHDIVRRQNTKDVPNFPLKHTVVLTGSTGSLGSHILEQLLKNDDVEKVYCMNRSVNAEARQKESFAKHHDPSVDFTKAVFIKTDFSTENFGLAAEIYSALLSTVTTFIHAAWSVDFNLSLESYEITHIAGTRRAIDFVSASTYNPPIIFISSISSVANWGTIAQDDSPLPETVISLFDNALTLPQGYGESKHVASQILAIASHRLGIRTAIVRAGQLGGPSLEHEKGAAWNRHEWLPTLVHTSKVLKKLPKTLGNQDRVDWVPMDKAASAILDISLAPPALFSEPTQVLHLVNPQVTSWNQLYPVIQAFYTEASQDSGTAIDAVDYNEWITELEQLPRTKDNAEVVPGLKLLEFYQGMRVGEGIGLPALETRRAEEVSLTLHRCPPVQGDLMRKWLKQWEF